MWATAYVAKLDSLAKELLSRTYTLTKIPGKDVSAENWKTSGFLPGKVHWKSKEARTGYLKSYMHI